MAGWKNEELKSIGAAEEIEIAPLRRDGKLGDRVTIWAVRQGDDLYVRSVKGRGGAWFRGTQERHEGRIWAGRVQKDVTFVDAGGEGAAEIDAAYRAKYRRYAGEVLDSVLTTDARATTLKVVPRRSSD